MSVFVRLRADPLPQNQELTMAILDDVLGAMGSGAKNRTWALRRRRRGKLGIDPSSIGMSIGRFVTAALICEGGPDHVECGECKGEGQGERCASARCASR